MWNQFVFREKSPDPNGLLLVNQSHQVKAGVGQLAVRLAVGPSSTLSPSFHHQLEAVSKPASTPLAHSPLQK